MRKRAARPRADTTRDTIIDCACAAVFFVLIVIGLLTKWLGAMALGLAILLQPGRPPTDGCSTIPGGANWCVTAQTKETP